MNKQLTSCKGEVKGLLGTFKFSLVALTVYVVAVIVTGEALFSPFVVGLALCVDIVWYTVYRILS